MSNCLIFLYETSVVFYFCFKYFAFLVAMINRYYLLIIPSLIKAQNNANIDLVLANNGMHIGTDNPLNRRILSDTANYNNVIGHDPELEQNSRSVKHFLDHYKTETNPTEQEWLNVKNLASRAVGGDCASADKLFQSHIIPSHEYEKLQKRCGRHEANHQINGHLQLLRAQEKAGNTLAHAQLDHLEDHALAQEASHMGEPVIHNMNLANQMTGQPLGYGLYHGIPGKGVHDSFMDDSAIKHDAAKYLNKDQGPLVSKLQAINTPFTHETVDRIAQTRKAAENALHGVPGAGEHFSDLMADNEEFMNHSLGHEGLDGAIRAGLGLSSRSEQPTTLHYDPHDVPIEDDVHALDHAVGHGLGPYDHPPEADRVGNFEQTVYEDEIHSGASIDVARANASIAGALANHYEDNLASGMSRPTSLDAAIHDVSLGMNLDIPPRLINDLERYDAEYGFPNEMHLPASVERERLRAIKHDIRDDGYILDRAADEIRRREQIAEAKAIDAEVKAKIAEDKIKEANLTEEQKRVVDHLKALDEAAKPTPEEKLELDMLLNKKERYEKAIKKDQEGKIGNPRTLKDLKEIKEQFDEITERNSRIVAEEQKDREDAAYHMKERNALHPIPAKPVEIINSEHIIGAEREDAKNAEEFLAKRAEEKEIAEAGSIAAQNVKRLGGSDEEAAGEAEKAEKLKRKMIKEAQMSQALNVKKALSPQMGEEAAIAAAEHIAAAHAGRNPMGATPREIKNNMEEAEMKEEEEKHENNTSQEERLGIIRILPDNITEISADNSSIDLPLTELPMAKAKTQEEQNIKEEQENLRDNVRNKVTKTNPNSGLVAVKGDEGFLNLPESCKEVIIVKGTVYFDQAGYDHMVAQKLDVTPLKPVFTRGSVPLYYKCDIKDMKMKLPSILNSTTQKLLFNDFENINIEFAKKIDIVNGTVECEPWNKFSSRMRPKVYQGVNKGANEVPSFIKKEFERIESMSDGMKDAKVNVVKNPDGSVVAEIKPQYGVSSKMTLEEAVNRAEEIDSLKTQIRLPENYLDAAQEETIGSTENFLKEMEKDLKNRNGRPEVLNVKGAMSAEAFEAIRNLKQAKSVEEMAKGYLRNGNDEATRVFNHMIGNSAKKAQEMNMSQEDFLESLDKVGHDTITQLLDFYMEASASVDSGKKLSTIDQQEFAAQIKESFPNKSASEVVSTFFEDFSEVLKGPNALGKLPENQPAAYSEKCSANCYNPVLKRCMLNCGGAKGASLKVRLNNNGQLAKRTVTKDNVVVNEPIINTNNMKGQQLAPLDICKGNQTFGCLLQGQLPPIMNSNSSKIYLTTKTSAPANLSVQANPNYMQPQPNMQSNPNYTQNNPNMQSNPNYTQPQPNIQSNPNYMQSQPNTDNLPSMSNQLSSVRPQFNTNYNQQNQLAAQLVTPIIAAFGQHMPAVGQYMRTIPNMLR